MPAIRATSRRSRPAAIACCRTCGASMPHRARRSTRAMRHPARPCPRALRRHGGAARSRSAGLAGVLLLSALGAWLARRGPASTPPASSSIGDLDLAIAASLGARAVDGGHRFRRLCGVLARRDHHRLQLRPVGTLRDLRRGARRRVHADVAHRRRRAGHPASMVAGRPRHRVPRDGGNGIWIVPSRGGAARKITDFGAHPTWSPDGRRVVFQSRPPADLNPGGSFGAESTIWIADVDGRAPPSALTTPGRPVGSHGVPQWWPGSDRVVFAVICASRRLPGHRALDDRAGQRRPAPTERESAPDGGVRRRARWTRRALRGARDQRAVVAAGRRRGLEAGEPRPTALPVTGPSAREPRDFTRRPPDRLDRLRPRAAGSGRRRSAMEPSTRNRFRRPLVPASDVGWRAGVPAVAPDGRLAFVGNRGNAGNNIFLVEPGRPPRQLTTDARDHYSPFWLQGEDALAVLANHGDGIGVVAARSRHGPRAAPLPLQGRSASGWRAVAGHGPGGGHHDQRRLASRRDGLRPRRGAEPVDDEPGPARRGRPAGPTHVRADQRLVRLLVARRALAGVSMHARGEPADLRGGRRGHGASAAADARGGHAISSANGRTTTGCSSPRSDRRCGT